jgi:two-component system sensor histidine kinase/response regulator
LTTGAANIYQQLIGKEEEFSLREVLFHRTCFIIALALNAALIVSIFLGFWDMVLVIIIGEIILTIAFWLSRFMKRFYWAWWMVIVCGYLFLGTNFFLNGGNEGPTLLLSYISLVFLSATTKSQFQWIWALIHSLIFGSIALYTFYVDASWVIEYPSQEVRILDLVLSYIIGAFLISMLFSMVRAAYEKQKERAILQHKNILSKEQELKDSNKDLTRILSILAHDVRNPLASIEGYLQLNEAGDLDPSMRASLNHDLLKLVKGTSYMLDDMLHWSKGQLHGHTTNMSEQMLGPWLRPTLEHMEALAKAKNIRLVSEYKSTQRVFADPNMTTVILRNLLQNAIKFSPSQTQISLEVKVQENFLIIQVKDEGIGINQEELSKLFTLNAKSKIGTQQEHGSGLGLILCKDYTEAQGGSISAESELGKGSTFTVCLPQELEAEEEEQVERD